MASLSFLLAGNPTTGEDTFRVFNPYTQAVIREVYRPSRVHVASAIEALAAVQPKLRDALPTYKRVSILERIAEQIAAHADELAQLIVSESGKPLQYAQAEVARGAQTFSFAANALQADRGEVLPLDVKPGLTGKLGLVSRVPAGPVLAITPFNFPLNLVAHKVAPAIMAGNGLLLKPASATPLTALRLADFVLEAGWPPEALSVLPLKGRATAPAVEDERLKVLSFTGGDGLGWDLKRLAGKKKVLLELGGDAAVIVAADADLDLAAKACAVGAFAYAGQVCISVQRIVVEQAVADAFREKFLAVVADIPVGDPQDPATVCGPMIDANELERLQGWIEEAQQAGAICLRAGEAIGQNVLTPTVLEAVPGGVRLAHDEAFGPVVHLQVVPTFGAAIAAVNKSRFGLQAGVFTRDEAMVKQAFRELEVGGVVVNQGTHFRVDHMPYGGVKDSGFGREGVGYAYEEMTEPRLLVW